jgi:DNA repair exonuclease SbcCD ATPase subunit
MFKDIKFMVMEEALDELKITTNDFLPKLGLDDWTIEYLVDRETKKGTIVKGFEVFIQASHNYDLVPFKAWSGGERSRLRLAGTFGLSEFLINRKGHDFNVRFFDEPTRWLSSEGIEDLISFMKEKAISDKKVYFIIDHKGFNNFGFTDIFTIINSKDRGSYFDEKG